MYTYYEMYMEHGIWNMTFSKVNVLVSFRYKITIKLTFENFYKLVLKQLFDIPFSHLLRGLGFRVCVCVCARARVCVCVCVVVCRTTSEGT